MVKGAENWRIRKSQPFEEQWRRHYKQRLASSKTTRQKHLGHEERERRWVWLELSEQMGERKRWNYRMGKGMTMWEVLGQSKEFGLYYKCVERHQKDLVLICLFSICTSLMVLRLWDTIVLSMHVRVWQNMARVRMPTFHVQSER